MIQLRDAAAGDAPAVARIYVDSWNRGFGHLKGLRELTPDLVDRWRNDLAGSSADWTVAVIDCVIVGFVGVGPSRDPIDPTLGELHAIAVDPPRWQQGVGRALMAHALDGLRATWSSAIVWTPANYALGDSFYRAAGWRPLDRIRSDGTEIAFGRDL